MVSNRRRVEIVLYGTGHLRRFTQDTPVLLDVWTEFLRAPQQKQSVLLEPWQDTPPFEMAQAIPREDGLHPIYNRTLVEVTLDFEQLARLILPLTSWYISLWDVRAKTRRPLALPSAQQLWCDIPGVEAPSYAHRRILPLIRMIGVLAHGRDMPAEADNPLIRRLDHPDGIEHDLDWAKLALQGARKVFRAFAPRADGTPRIFSISRNRPGSVAQDASVRTVKADAALSLFSVDCSRLTWAIVDGGIDATHPAFGDGRPLPRNASVAEKLKRSRVKETYDFSQLRELLLGDEDIRLPQRPREAARLNEDRLEIVRRIDQGRPVEWELLRPILRIPHDATYARRQPTDGHGTHVAGILAGNWQRAENESFRGVCPDINLIDIRVCRPDGSSDEFTIISALQFIRDLNANAELMAVHGINMSLSLIHDAANFACGRTPVCVEAERTVNSGVVVVAAAGNQGYRRLLDETETAHEQFLPVSITDPGNAEAVITVGSTHRLEPHTYGVSYFSSRGPTGDGRIKPDLVAPGEKIYAPSLNGEGMRLDGTSMAAPHVSGAAAMLMARHVELIGQPQRVKQVLCRTATDLGRERYFQGHGLVDVLRAMQSV